MHSQFQTVNPFREPSWRFDRVLKLIEHRPRPRRCSPKDDDFVREYRNFALKLRTRHDAEDQMALFPHHPGIFLANLFHHQPDKEWRYLVQARILTGGNNEAIAAKMGTLPSAIDWYERVFFNVRDRLSCTDYITKMVIGRLEDRGPMSREGRLSEFQEQMSYKLFGYFGGPLILDVLFSGFQKTAAPARVNQVQNWFDDTYATLIRRKSTPAARHFEINKFNILQLMELHVKLIEVTRETGGAKGDFEQNVQKVLEEIPWELAKAARDNHNTLQQIYDETAIEPRADEQMMLAAGLEPPTLRMDRRLRLRVEEE